MDKLLIRGGRSLTGTVDISGAKNAALPELCAALLTADTVTLQNVPRLQDVVTMLKLIRNMGVSAERNDAAPGTIIINAGSLSSPEAPYELVKTMRASVTVMVRTYGPFDSGVPSAPRRTADSVCTSHGSRVRTCSRYPRAIAMALVRFWARVCSLIVLAFALASDDNPTASRMTATIMETSVNPRRDAGARRALVRCDGAYFIANLHFADRSRIARCRTV